MENGQEAGEVVMGCGEMAVMRQHLLMLMTTKLLLVVVVMMMTTMMMMMMTDREKENKETSTHQGEESKEQTIAGLDAHATSAFVFHIDISAASHGCCTDPCQQCKRSNSTCVSTASLPPFLVLAD